MKEFNTSKIWRKPFKYNFENLKNYIDNYCELLIGLNKSDKTVIFYEITNKLDSLLTDGIVVEKGDLIDILVKLNNGKKICIRLNITDILYILFEEDLIGISINILDTKWMID